MACSGAAMRAFAAAIDMMAFQMSGAWPFFR